MVTETDQQRQVDPRIALEELASRAARRHLIPFTHLTKSDYRPSWHQELTAEKLEQVERGEINRLMIFEPPRHGKSELSSVRFPSWYLGKNPTRHFIQASYAAELALDFGRKVRNLTEESAELFPNSQMSPDSTAAGRWSNRKGGSYMAAGVGGPISGRGAHILNIDDPVKDRKQADSKIYRDSTWAWYTDVAYTRLSGQVPGPAGAVVLTMTRWHKDDLAGRILAKAKETGERWTVLSLPAIAERDEPFRKAGEALWPAAFPLDKLEAIKATIGTRAWLALYQQTPTEEEGGIFKRQWWKYYNELPNTTQLWIQSWDMSFKETADGSFVVGQVWAVKGANKYLVDQVRERMDFVAAKKAVVAMKNKYPQTSAILVEDKANGPAIVSDLKNSIPGLIEIPPDGGKEARASAASPEVEAGNVHLPISPGWVDEYVDELADFPSGTNDDQVDATSQALNYLRSGRFEFESWGQVESNKF